VKDEKTEFFLNFVCVHGSVPFLGGRRHSARRTRFSTCGAGRLSFQAQQHKSSAQHGALLRKFDDRISFFIDVVLSCSIMRILTFIHTLG